MMDKSTLLQKMFEKGFEDASRLQEKAAKKEITETEIIANETMIPIYDVMKDYTAWPVGSPVVDENQVWLLLQPHNASHYNSKPADLRALWGLAHTKIASQAKAYVAPYGTSGLYMLDECCVWTDEKVYRSLIDNNAYTPADYPAGWEEVII